MNNDQDKTQEKNMTPPYLSKIKLNAVIDYVSSRNLAEVSVDTFLKNDFGSADAGLAVNALKFLGFIDDAGKSTELMTKLRLTGDARKQAFEKIVKDAYKKLFDAVPAPQDLPLNQLISDLRVHYNLSKRVADSAAPALVKLMEFAGLKEETATRKATLIKKQAGQTKPKETKKSSQGDNSTDVSNPDLTSMKYLEGQIVIQITSELMKNSIGTPLGEKLTALVTAARDYEKAAQEQMPKDQKNKAPDSEEETRGR